MERRLFGEMSELCNKLLFLLLVLIILNLLPGCSGTNSSGNTLAPQNAAIQINLGATSVSSQDVTLTLSATDNVAVTAYYVSESSASPDKSDAGWVAVTPSANYIGTASFRMSDGYGKKTVYAWFKNNDQNISTPASAAINLNFISSDSSVGNPNIIVIVVDTLRADHLSTYGYARKTDPNIAAFAQQAVIFQNAIAPAPWTKPSYTSILESKLAFNHNMNLTSNSMPDGVMLTSYLRGTGYKTVAVQTNEMLTFLKNGDYFDEIYRYTDESAIEFLDQGAIDKATNWIDADSNIANKFFLFIGMMSPHWTYKTDNGFLDEFVGDDLYNSTGPLSSKVVDTHGDGCWTYSMLSSELQDLVGEPVSSSGYYEDARLYIAGYDSEIKYADYQIGRLLQELKNKGLYDDSLIIITADHGENMVEHSTNFSHGNNLYQSLLHVPLLIKFPRQTTQRIITDVVRTIDILPTVFDYSSISYDGTDGKSLLPVINGEEVNYDERPVISYRIATDGSGNEEVSLIKDGYKLIRNKDNGTNILYNLNDDPSEITDLSARKQDTVYSLNDFLGKFFTKW